MSYTTYLGVSRSLKSEILKIENELNFIVEEAVIAENIKHLISRPFIYECMTLSESPITFNWNTEFSLYNKRFTEESITAFLDLCEFLRHYLNPDETAILYAEWIDDPSGEILKQEILLNDLQVKKIWIGHKTYLILKNKG